MPLDLYFSIFFCQGGGWYEVTAWWEAAEETQTECWCGEGALHIGESPVTQDNLAASDHVLYSQLKILQLPFPL